jgi:hypothetical protein
MFWGIFPIKPGISWESHLWGSASGLLLALYYRHQGPVRPVSSWEKEPEEEEDGSEEEEFNEDITPEEDQENLKHVQ